MEPEFKKDEKTQTYTGVIGNVRMPLARDELELLTAQRTTKHGRMA